MNQLKLFPEEKHTFLDGRIGYIVTIGNTRHIVWDTIPEGEYKERRFTVDEQILIDMIGTHNQIKTNAILSNF